MISVVEMKDHFRKRKLFETKCLVPVTDFVIQNPNNPGTEYKIKISLYKSKADETANSVTMHFLSNNSTTRSNWLPHNFCLPTSAHFPAT